MSRLPYFKFFVADVAFETRGFDAHERAAYLSLLIRQWAYGPLPDDDDLLAKYAEVRPDVWRRIGPTLRQAFLPTSEGALALPWMEEQRENLAKTRTERAEAGARGGEANSLKSKETREANAKQKPKQTPSKPEAVRAREVKKDTPLAPQKPVEGGGGQGGLFSGPAPEPKPTPAPTLTVKAGRPKRPRAGAKSGARWPMPPPPREIPEEIGEYRVAGVIEECLNVLEVGEDFWPEFKVMVADMLTEGASHDRHIIPTMREAKRRGVDRIDSAGWFAFRIRQRRINVAA